MFMIHNVYDSYLIYKMSKQDDSKKKIRDTVIEYLIYYKSLSHIHPDWNNVECPHIIDENIRKYMMTYCLKKEYQNIEHYRDSINNVFQRALWDLNSKIASMRYGKIVYNEECHADFVNLLTGYALLCVKREKDDFEQEFRFQVKRIMRDMFYKKHNTQAPEISDNEIIIPDISDSDINISHLYNPSYSTGSIDPDTFFVELCEIFKTKAKQVTLNTIF